VQDPDKAVDQDAAAADAAAPRDAAEAPALASATAAVAALILQPDPDAATPPDALPAARQTGAAGRAPDPADRQDEQSRERLRASSRAAEDRSEHQAARPVEDAEAAFPDLHSPELKARSEIRERPSKQEQPEVRPALQE